MAGRLPASALRPLVLAMAGWWSAGLHAQAVGSGIPDLPVAEPAVEQAPEVPPVAGQLVPKLPEPETVRKEPDARPRSSFPATAWTATTSAAWRCRATPSCATTAR